MKHALIHIVAMTPSGVIGQDNALPWYIPEDLKHFQKVTHKRVVIMGRKTFESIGRLLPNRYNIVISRSTPPGAIGDNGEYVQTIEDAILAAKTASSIGYPIYVIGGGAIYRETIDLADEVVVSMVHTEVPGDTAYPIDILYRDFKSHKVKDLPNVGPHVEVLNFKRKDACIRV